MFNYDQGDDNCYNLEAIVHKILNCEDKDEFMDIMKDFDNEILMQNFEYGEQMKNDEIKTQSITKQGSFQSILKNKYRI